eukprot:217560_1
MDEGDFELIFEDDAFSDANYNWGSDDPWDWGYPEVGIHQTDKKDEITIIALNNIAHESLVYGYLKEIYKHKSVPPSFVNNLCFMFYFDHNSWAQIDSFIQNQIQKVSKCLNIQNNISLCLLLKHKWNINEISNIDNKSQNTNQETVSNENISICQLCNQS